MATEEGVKSQDFSVIYQPSPSDGPLFHGEILSDIVQPLVNFGEPGGDIVVEKKNHPFVLIMSQACDLDRAFKKGSQGDTHELPNILFCEVEEASALRNKPWIRDNKRVWDLII